MSMKTGRAAPPRTSWVVGSLMSLMSLMSGACGDSKAAVETQDSQRVAALEAHIEALEAQLHVQGGNAFDIQCPAPWQSLGAVGDAVWTCRKDQPLEGGFWPNCNVTEAAVDAGDTKGITAKESLDASLARFPQLKSARRISDRASALDTQAAHEAIYDHDLLSKPLRVLATVTVHANATYAVSCAAPPEAFAANEAAFRQITRSFRFKP